MRVARPVAGDTGSPRTVRLRTSSEGQPIRVAYLAVGALGLAACAAGSGRARPDMVGSLRACTFYQTHDMPIVDASTLGSEFRYLTISSCMEYPIHMRAAGQSGMVALNFDVDTSGRVDRAARRTSPARWLAQQPAGTLSALR